jgi:formylglycine-generating enzyme required for sulfatase activity
MPRTKKAKVKTNPAINVPDTASSLVASENGEFVYWDYQNEAVMKQLEDANTRIKALLGIDLEFVHIPSGSYMMGDENNGPVHRVNIQEFGMSKFLITQDQWEVVARLPQVEIELKENPSYFSGDRLPVESITWYEAKEFCARISRYLALEIDLPSEAQWEYACRAGTTTNFYFGDTITKDQANFNSDKTSDVGIYPPNAWGLYDMHGNVWEWCEDDWHENYEGAPTDGSAWVDY